MLIVGNILTKAALDVETKRGYWLTVYAQDHGVVPLSSSLQVSFGIVGLCTCVLMNFQKKKKNNYKCHVHTCVVAEINYHYTERKKTIIN